MERKEGGVVGKSESSSSVGWSINRCRPFEGQAGSWCLDNKPSVVGQRLPLTPPQPHLMNPQNCGYVTLCGKRHFAGVIKLGTLKWGGDPGSSRWDQYNDKGPCKRCTWGFE